jgi:hypothetical protein
MIDKHYLQRYTDYLNEVVAYYNKNKSLNNFSKIADKHRITKMNRDYFFIANLHLWGNKPLTQEKVLEVLKLVKGYEVQVKQEFPDNEFITWEHPNGCRTVAYTANFDGHIPYILNFRGRKDEEDRIWVCDSPGTEWLRGVKMVKSTKEDIENFTKALFNSHYLDFKETEQSLF